MNNQALIELLTLRGEVDNDGTVRYYNSDGQLHRIHGPAVEYLNGDKIWFRNNKYHRTNGPAIEWNHGELEWYVNDKKWDKVTFELVYHHEYNLGMWDH